MRHTPISDPQPRLQLIEARGTSMVSGPIALHLLGRFESFVRLNAAAADYLPWSLASGWMFALKFAGSADES